MSFKPPKLVGSSKGFASGGFKPPKLAKKSGFSASGFKPPKMAKNSGFKSNPTPPLLTKAGKLLIDIIGF